MTELGLVAIGWLAHWWWVRLRTRSRRLATIRSGPPPDEPAPVLLCAHWDPPEGVGRDTHVCHLNYGHTTEHECKCGHAW